MAEATSSTIGRKQLSGPVRAQCPWALAKLRNTPEIKASI